MEGLVFQVDGSYDGKFLITDYSYVISHTPAVSPELAQHIVHTCNTRAPMYPMKEFDGMPILPEQNHVVSIATLLANAMGAEDEVKFVTNNIESHYRLWEFAKNNRGNRM